MTPGKKVLTLDEFESTNENGKTLNDENAVSNKGPNSHTHTHKQPKKHAKLREEEDVNELLKTVSNDASLNRLSVNLGGSQHLENSTMLGETQDDEQIIGNTLGFSVFGSKFKDTKESREAENDATQHRHEYVGKESDDNKARTKRPSLGALLKSFLRFKYNGIPNVNELAQHENEEEGRGGKEHQHDVSGTEGAPVPPKLVQRQSRFGSIFRSETGPDGLLSEAYWKRRFNFHKKPPAKDKKALQTHLKEQSTLDNMIQERAQLLVGALGSGAPAISLLASCLLEDEHGIARAPLLLNLLVFKVTDISPHVNTRVRRFRIDFEYGVTNQRLKWSVQKTAKDLLYLHSKLKLTNFRVHSSKSLNLPSCPTPPIRTAKKQKTKMKSFANPKSEKLESKTSRPKGDATGNEGISNPETGINNDKISSNDLSNDRSSNNGALHANGQEALFHISEQNEDDNSIAPRSPSDLKSDEPKTMQMLQNVSGPEIEIRDGQLHESSTKIDGEQRQPSKAVKRKALITHSLVGEMESLLVPLARLRSNLSSLSGVSFGDEGKRSKVEKNDEYIKAVEVYLSKIISIIGLKPQSNKLFQFFEVSPLSSLLCYETGYSGKQGLVHIGGTTKSQGWRVGHFRANDLRGMISRRSHKWLLIRHSYVTYVSNINSTSPLEVFLVDGGFKIIFNLERDEELLKSESSDSDTDLDDSSIALKVIAESEVETVNSSIFNHLKITLENNERKLVLLPRSRREQLQWIGSLNKMKNSTIWAEKHRFGSFAPIRENVLAQWFVDGRDYFWAVSSALEMAKDVIYIHDWWLSPELYMRRPGNGNQQWRLDRILQRKAQQGVKIFVIVYRNVGSTVATDSLYTKHSLINLHPENIHVIRSPNQLLQNTFFWAHHEKLCIIDQTIAFLGGIDLCFGRYDTPDHVLVDDSKLDFQSLNSEFRPAQEEYSRFQTFPGKDYSNPRVKDFFELDKPYESMYDREKVPRMPWHDVHMVTSGKVARDLARHFVQRWNYLLRQKRPSRFTPLLTPPSDMTDEEVEMLGLTGTCEIQLLRSSGSWALGLKEHEQSIQHAYLKLIETSEHFVYIENQFFITACFIDGTEIKNRIGDALVDRIIRAHENNESWRAVIVIPLMPGFESQVDEPDGSSVRVIMQCQFMSISRGSTSIFAKLRKYGIDPDDYIQFYSLRKWGRIGPDRTLVTEQLYIHAKTMIVDDRAAIIGSANINERSMRGVRDSEVAAVIRDKETIETTMAGEPWKAGKFPHSLRCRLMREHLGIDVDIYEIVERRFAYFERVAKSPEGLRYATSAFYKPENVLLSAMVEIASRDILGERDGTSRFNKFNSSRNVDVSNLRYFDEDLPEEEDDVKPLPLPVSFNNRTGAHEANKGIRDKKKLSYDQRVQHNDSHTKDVYGEGIDKYRSKLAKKARLNSSKFLKELANKQMKTNPTDLFLPDEQAVKEFLELDDSDMIDEMDRESEDIISARNKERWRLLKKISYLQRVTAKAKAERESEYKKRGDAGYNSHNTSNADDMKQQLLLTKVVKGEISDRESRGSPNPPGSANVPFIKDEQGMTSIKVQTDVASESVPITSLTEEGVRDLMDSIIPKNLPHFSNFIDPYDFEDPMSVELFDNWVEHARINTEIFRWVFHTQPDDMVLTWKDYKRYGKLNKAFGVLQEREAKYRRQNRSFIAEDTDSDDEESGDKADTTFDMSSLANDYGLLGEAPPSAHSSTSNLNKVNGRKKQIKFNMNSVAEEEQGTESSTTPDQESQSESSTTSQEPPNLTREQYQGQAPPQINAGSKPRKRLISMSAKRAHMDNKIFDRNTAERLLSEIRGHLVIFPSDWLMSELEGGNWFYNTDRLPPIDIYD
ncbi:Phospholipase D1 [Scheffersomyces spartinae]|uniref:Phospholipase D1 n=1 Tax=Scheffersomyces spartinae TaxID=45513 RepID=A0A9P7VDW4_9ASCO|nr:Phospholipase D1 [Scheffersomyces spartinae]KAG7196064.1 Phospholipase D1 [Scheffersomyces spartinae]